MKKKAFLLALHYIFPLIFFIFSLFKIASHASFLPKFPQMIGEWEVVCFWIVLCWFFILSVSFVISKNFKLVSISRKETIVLFSIFVVGFVLRAVVAPRTHRLFYDEDIYLNIAQNIQSSNQALMCNNGSIRFGKLECSLTELNKDPNGWPFALSLALNFFKSPEIAGTWVSILMSSFTIFLVFLIGRELFFSTIALWGAGIYALMPAPIQWAPSVEPSTFFTFLICSLILLQIKKIKTQNPRFSYLIYPLLFFTFQAKPEALLVFPLLLLIDFFAGESRLSYNRTHWVSWVFFLMFLLPYGLHLLHVRDQDWGSLHGPKLSAIYFPHNLKDNVLFFLSPNRFPSVDVLFIFLGLWQIRKNRLAKCSLVPWLVTYFGFYLFFYGGSYNFGVDFRFSLPIHVPLALLAGLGVDFLAAQTLKRGYQTQGIWVGLLLFCLAFELPAIHIIGEEGWQSRTDHEFIQSLLPQLPQNAMIFSRTSSEVMTGGRGGIQLYEMKPELVENLRRQGKSVYFYFDVWCGTPKFKDECQEVINHYVLESVARERIRYQTLALYKVLGKKEKLGR